MSWTDTLVYKNVNRLVSAAYDHMFSFEYQHLILRLPVQKRHQVHDCTQLSISYCQLQWKRRHLRMNNN